VTYSLTNSDAETVEVSQFCVIGIKPIRWHSSAYSLYKSLRKAITIKFHQT